MITPDLTAALSEARGALEAAVFDLESDEYAGLLSVSRAEAAITPLIQRLQEERDGFEMRLRTQLWLNHGHPHAALYGDDGEMQCNQMGCMLDFKRDSFELRAEVNRLTTKAGGVELHLKSTLGITNEFAGHNEIVDAIYAQSQELTALREARQRLRTWLVDKHNSNPELWAIGEMEGVLAELDRQERDQ